MKNLFRLVCFVLALASFASADDFTGGLDTDGNGSVARTCASPDQDCDGFYPSGSGEGPASAGVGQTNGAQVLVTTINVDRRHTFAPGKIAHFYDSVTAGYVNREVLDTTGTSITIAGATVTVTDNLAITSQAQYDCNNSDFYDYPGIVIDAGSGNVKTCQSDGTYTSPVALASFTAHTGSGATYFIDDAGTTTCSGNGTTPGTAWHPRCFMDTGISGYHAPVPGDAFVMKDGGTYNFSFTTGGVTHEFFTQNVDGTAANRIKLIGIQGLGATVQTSTSGVPPFQFEGTDFWTLQGFKVDGNSIKSNVGMYLTPANHFIVRSVEIKNIDGDTVPGGNNTSCFTLNGDASYNFINHVFFHDCYDHDSTDYQNGNNRQFVAFEGTGNILTDFVFMGKPTTGSGSILGYKHGEENGDFTCHRGRLKDGYLYGLEYDQPNSWFKNILIVDASHSGGIAISNFNVGGTPFYDNSLLENITVVNSTGNGGGIDTRPTESSVAVGNPWLTFTKSIIQVAITSFASDGTNAFYRIHHYADSTEWSFLFSPTKKFVLLDNKLINKTNSNFFATIAGGGSPGDSGTGATYTSLSSLQSAGWDTSSEIKDCSLDTNLYTAGDAACYDYDWFWTNDTGGGSSTTTTSTSTSSTSSTSTTTSTGTTSTIGGATNVGGLPPVMQ